MAFCLGTLVDLLDQILHPDQHDKDWILDIKKIPQIHSLFQKASFLRDFLANSTPTIQARIETLEDLVRDAAENAEDMLESYLKAHVLLNHSFMTSSPGLPKFYQKIRCGIRSHFFLRDNVGKFNPIQARSELDIPESYIKAQSLRQMQSLFQKASFLRKFVANSAPIQINFEMLEDVIRGAAKNAEVIVESYSTADLIGDENISQIQSLSGNSCFLRCFLADSGPAIRATMENLEDQDLPSLYNILLPLEGIIRDAAENVQELVRSYPYSSGQIFMISPPDLSEVTQVFESATSEMIKITNDGGQSENISHVPPRRNDLNSNDVLVGVDKCLMELRDRLTSLSPTLEIIPIVGMGGIGKTTLARKLYNEYSSSKHFDICLWATISQEYDQRRVLLSLLGCTSDKENAELKLDLYQKLCSRRYLIVLDDVWSSRVWDDIHMFAPENNNRSRIILTTRENDVADYVSSRRHEMQQLNKKDSWELFGKFAHAGEKCPDELVEIAQEIVRKCGGLPLALQVIGGFMLRAERTKDFWEKVAGDIRSYIAKEDDQFSAIFSWSYANLPHYLKPCLLYIGAFPEDHAIDASRLIKLWVAEGFLNPIKNKSLEEVAETYLNVLIDRNLIFVRERTFSRRAKSYGIHDLLRDLCMRKAEEKRFIFTKKMGASEDPLCKRRVCISSDDYRRLYDFELELMTRSFQIIDYEAWLPLPNIRFELSLLHVLDIHALRLSQFPGEISKLVKLKYLALSCELDCKSPSSIAVLQNLQTIKFSIPYARNFVEGISHLQQLRHLESTFYTIDWAPHSAAAPHPGKLFTLAETVQSLKYVSAALLAQLVGKLPNLKSLVIDGDDWEGEPNIDLARFPRLEIIEIRSSNKLNPIFPQTLRELGIYRPFGEVSRTSSFMSRIGALPNLQLLRLYAYEFEDKTWEPTEGEFCNLQYLQLKSSKLENWIADETHFPQLKHLVIDNCLTLNEIPVEFGGIETLEIIELDWCKASVYRSAKSIRREKLDFGDQSFQLRVECIQLSDDEDQEEVEVDHYDGPEST